MMDGSVISVSLWRWLAHIIFVTQYVTQRRKLRNGKETYNIWWTYYQIR